MSDLRPRSCELCDCRDWKWNGCSAVLRTDPPSTCVCGHLTMRHRFVEVSR